MKHATEAALDALEPLLAEVRKHGALKEKSRGVFYRSGRAILHFHEDPEGLFADLHIGAEWQRLPVNTKAEQAALLRELGEAKRPRGLETGA
jgi:hypothetical protein